MDSTAARQDEQNRATSDFVRSIEKYVGLLRAETLQAQNMRMQVRGAKIVFLGSLYAYALPKNDALAVLVAPFAAFAFDCVIYGLTYNIQEIGAYIRDYVEPFLPKPDKSELERAQFNFPFLHWETAIRQARYKASGRAFARIGNYGVTFLVCVLAFVTTRTKVSLYTLTVLLIILLFGYIPLVWLEFKTKDLTGTLLPRLKVSDPSVTSTQIVDSAKAGGSSG